jgi:hypothetical protein
LHVVAKTVDEEVRAGIDAADDKLVAVALALMDRDAGNIARDVGEFCGLWSWMKLLVSTLTDCGMLTRAVFVFVATAVLLE